MITVLMPVFGVTGTVLLFGGFALNAVACALLLQPVLWHAKKISLVDELQAEGIKVCEIFIFLSLFALYN